ncbi:hypothetical protein HMPREF9442_03153 [Paraprevotella xylaniphila YIT 11841]|uniref:Uncharacterized protein n=1 Tax=Paraprevotella xylaniphila YIT 11841 TaxID=762982 RepID=F3QY61_9BACT|nr:hypothetical protein HMPREF9442_03153 [Paraprevotella xylaniphila YIT 11841]
MTAHDTVMKGSVGWDWWNALPALMKKKRVVPKMAQCHFGVISASIK